MVWVRIGMGSRVEMGRVGMGRVGMRIRGSIEDLSTSNIFCEESG